MLYYFLLTSPGEPNREPERKVFARNYHSLVAMEEGLNGWNRHNAPYYRYQLIPKACVKKLFPAITDRQWRNGEMLPWPL